MESLTERFRDALTFAAELHDKQFRKGTATPYVAHLLSVAGIVLDYGGAEDEAIAALLHDSVEDQGGAETAEAIRARFGESDLFHFCCSSGCFPLCFAIDSSRRSALN